MNLVRFRVGLKLFGQPNIDSKEKKQAATVKKYPEDFVGICKYLLYCSPIVALPVGGNLTTAIREAIEKSGSKENIYIWCYPTPMQRTILKHPKLILASPFGSGKTLFETVKGIELSSKGEKVLFLLFLNRKRVPTKIKPLLAYDLEQKFRKHPNIRVEVVFFKDGSSKNLKSVARDLNPMYIHIYLSMHLRVSKFL